MHVYSFLSLSVSRCIVFPLDLEDSSLNTLSVVNELMQIRSVSTIVC
jgi:hypothetical protein